MLYLYLYCTVSNIYLPELKCFEWNVWAIYKGDLGARDGTKSKGSECGWIYDFQWIQIKFHWNILFRARP